MKEINVFTYGDSNDVKTWSNVPFMFTKSLENRGIIVNRINIAPNWLADFLFSFVRKMFSLFFPGHFYCMDRSWVHQLMATIKINRVIRKNRNADFSLFFSYNYPNVRSDKPIVLFSDWTGDYVTRKQLLRSPHFFENWNIKRQGRAISKANIVFTLFGECAVDMEKVYGRKIEHIESNVVNNVDAEKFDMEAILAKKKASKSILFIGKKRYKEGAVNLIKVCTQLQKEGIEVELDIVGLEKNDLEIAEYPDGINFWGYLDKSNEQERTRYYELIKKSRVFANPTRLWAGYSSTIEALYFCTPIVVSRYDEFVREFGESLAFGYYCEESTLKGQLKGLLTMDGKDYEKMCVKAHRAVADYTWDNYCEAFINICKERGL